MSNMQTEAVVVTDVGRRKMAFKCDVHMQAPYTHTHTHTHTHIWIHEEDRNVLCYTEPSKRKGKHLYTER